MGVQITIKTWEREGRVWTTEKQPLGFCKKTQVKIGALPLALTEFALKIAPVWGKLCGTPPCVKHPFVACRSPKHPLKHPWLRMSFVTFYSPQHKRRERDACLRGGGAQKFGVRWCRWYRSGHRVWGIVGRREPSRLGVNPALVAAAWTTSGCTPRCV